MGTSSDTRYKTSNPENPLKHTSEWIKEKNNNLFIITGLSFPTSLFLRIEWIKKKRIIILKGNINKKI